jgi:hypothetical protein
MRHQHWLSLALMLSLGACGDSTPTNTTPGTDAGVTMNDVVATPTDTPATPTDTGNRADVRDAASTTLDYTTVRTGRRCTMDEDCTDGQTCLTTAQGRICTTGEGCEQGDAGRRGEPVRRPREHLPALRVEHEHAAPRHLPPRLRRHRHVASSLGACGDGLRVHHELAPSAHGLHRGDAGLPPALHHRRALRGRGPRRCGRNAVCNTRTGNCVNALAERLDAASPTARPATPMHDRRWPSAAASASRSARCAPTQGLCGSFINLRTTQQCADYDLETMAPRVPAG